MPELTDARLAAIEARCEKATKGPWHAWNRGIGFEVHGSGDDQSCDTPNCGGELNRNFRDTFEQQDADFIAHSREDVPDLLAALKQAREESRWIPVSERLPELMPPNEMGISASKVVLVSVRNVIGLYLAFRWRHDRLRDECWRHENHALLLGNVTHWRPLPELPE